MLLVKINDINKAFNCSDVKENLAIVKKMIDDKYISINSIYVEKAQDVNDMSHFYWFDKNKNELIKCELTKKNFYNCINNISNNNSNTSIDIINLYLISEYSYNENIYNLSMEEILELIPENKNEKETWDNNYKILFFSQYLLQSQLIYALYRYSITKENYDILILFNYSKLRGYQFCLYKDDEIKINPEKFKNIKNSEKIEKNIEIFVEEIKKFGIQRKIRIILAESIDSKNEEFNINEIGDLLKKYLYVDEDDKDKYIIDILNKDFNLEVEVNSHIFYLN